MIKLPTIIFVITISVLAVIHIIALELYLYWEFLWLDIPMHLLGGSAIALGVFAAHDFIKQFPKRLLYPIPVLLTVLTVALLWEVYELGIGIPIEDDFEVDTIVDLIMGMLGGVIGYVVAYSVSTFDIDREYESR